jgi:hypothetical protein
MPSIILSYRRSDSDVIAGRIRDRLAGHYGDESVFMDIDSIPFGLDFREHIKNALAQNDILIAIIGPSWLHGGNGTSPRIFDETDPVRIEVETALQRNIPVVPVLVGGAVMPKPSELPEGLRDLPFRNAAIVDGGRDFHQHMDRLIRSMDGLLAAKPSLATTAAPSASADALRLDSSREPQREHPLEPSRQKETAAKSDTGVALAGKQGGQQRYRDLALVGLAIALVATSAGLVFLWLHTNTAPSQVGVQQSTPPAPTQPTFVQPATQQQPTASNSNVLPVRPPSCNRINSSSAYYDPFKTQEFGWQPPIGGDVPGAGKVSGYENAGLSIAPKEAMTFMHIYSRLIFGDVNVCVRVVTPPQAPKEGSFVSAGIVLWFQDFGNNYTAQIFLDPGSYQIARNVNRS